MEFTSLERATEAMKHLTGEKPSEKIIQFFESKKDIIPLGLHENVVSHKLELSYTRQELREIDDLLTEAGLI